MAESELSKRERQIMDIVFQLGEATAADVHQRLPDPPTYTAVRTMMRLLEEKGLLQHHIVGRRYVYSPVRSPQAEGRSALRRVISVFFGGSLEDALAAHLSDPALKLDSAEMERLRSVIEQANEATSRNRSAKSKRKGQR
ncbi:MAG: BlaI/MecI/CopY family transcriptional regulator [Pirellulaceae bacterium]|nr:BlaI/MecI/CopY family transcriptional regulator [Planctomycetales bacterium]